MAGWVQQPPRSRRRPPALAPYEWARATARGQLVVRDLAEFLGISPHRARYLLTHSPYPRTLLVRKWLDPTTGTRYKRTLWTFPPETGALILSDRLMRHLRQARVALPPAWRQHTWRLRQRLKARYPVHRDSAREQ
jgi:hypothetical protein